MADHQNSSVSSPKLAFNTESELVSALKQGNEAAYYALTEKYQQRLFWLARGITLDSEESLDIVQEVFLTVHKSIHQFKGDSRFSTWLHRITVNTALNWKRRWKRRFKWHHQSLETEERDYLNELKADQDDPETSYTQHEMNAIIQKSLKALPEQARTVFILKEIEGLSYQEIADMLKIKRGTVSSRLFYARKYLQESLADFVN